MSTETGSICSVKENIKYVSWTERVTNIEVLRQV